MEPHLLGAAVHFHRKRAGLSRLALSILADISQTAIYDVEHGKQTVRLDTVLKILTALNMKLQLESPLMADFRNRSNA